MVEYTCRSGHASLKQFKSIDPDAELWPALQKLDRNGVNQLPVIRDHHVVGMLSPGRCHIVPADAPGIGNATDMTT